MKPTLLKPTLLKLVRLKLVLLSSASDSWPVVKCLSCLPLLAALAFGSRPVDAWQDSADLQQAITAVRDVGAGGQGHARAVAAIKVLNQADSTQVLQLLEGMDGANPLAANWLRGAIQSALDGQAAVPLEGIREYLTDRTRSDEGRLLAWELVENHQPEWAARQLPQMLDDPCLPLRRRAVDWHVDQAAQPEQVNKALSLLGYALTHARDVDQIREIAGKLGEQGLHVDLQKQLGVVNQWYVTGPFDNRGEKGFDTICGPETDPGNIDFESGYTDTRDDQPAVWQKHSTLDPTGVVNLNDLLGNLKGATAYAATEFESGEDQAVEIRIGCINANKVWVNGEEVINNEIYHVGMMPDQFLGKARLKKGTNTILFKVCQNEQEQAWAQDWMFQLRICQPDGSAVQPAPSRAAPGE